jgi:hypothetical protein
MPQAPERRHRLVIAHPQGTRYRKQPGDRKHHWTNRNRVAQAGRASGEEEGRFLDLVSWVETGVKPAGDDVLDPTEVANPLFGCNFTQGAHLLGVPCP